MNVPRSSSASRSLLVLVAISASFAAFPAGASGRALPGNELVRKWGRGFAQRLEQDPDRPIPTWIYFTDRAGAERNPVALEAARSAMSPRALDRRARRGSVEGPLVSDLPVHEAYVRALTARGARLRGTSRWLNAASVEIAPTVAAEIARLPFVARVEPVARGRFSEPGVEERPGFPVSTESTSPRPVGEAIAFAPGDTAYYGGAFRQLDMMKAPALHASGLSGAGVLVCILDSGFRVTHQAFAGLSIVATRDFIYGDTNVDRDSTQDAPGQADHGTWTLGCVAGKLPGVYSGTAFNAMVALAKTENISSETPAEMDYWQFAAEWADSLGADIISSSLGYSEFDNPADSYTYADMDGRTTVVTLAAAEAARRGITVVTAAGNAGAQPWHYIIAPGDADTVITSGAVDSFNVVASFSSRGPTADGRIKPDVTAMGRNVFLVSASNNTAYIRANGTSFSTPLTAGAAALLLEAHPAWRPYEVREALRETALNHLTPNNDIGWGLIQLVAAKNWVPSTTGVIGDSPASSLRIAAAPNPLRPGAGTRLEFGAPAGAVVEVVDLSGRRRARLFEGVTGSRRSVVWNGAADDGSMLPAGVYWARIRAIGASHAPAARSVRLVVIP
jgi:subtilisin family serine protease